MITINSTVSYDETKSLQQQTSDFQNWLFVNCLSKINDQLKPDSLDAYNRPAQYTFTVDVFSVVLQPAYQVADKSNWALSGYNLSIKLN